MSNSESFPFIIDAHLDLSMNAMEWNRDLRLSVADIRAREKGMLDKPDRGRSTVSLPALKKGRIGFVVATLIARFVEAGNPLPGWNSPEQAWAQTQGQLAWYKAMEKEGSLTQICDPDQLEEHVNGWLIPDNESQSLAYLLSLEGADSIIDLSYLETLYENGLRALGPAHYGKGRYAYGTDSDGGIGIQGKALLKEMDNLGIILDATHLCDTSFWEALKVFKGPVWASHSNCRSLVDHNRQFSDEQISELINRGAVIGGALDAWMLVPNWERGKTQPEDVNVRLGSMLDHLDHICQVAGNANHVGIGSDLDGGFGKEQCPVDLETIADLQKIPFLLKKRGFSAEDVNRVMYKNWFTFLKQNL